MPGSIAWHIAEDRALVCVVTAGATTEKTITTIADAICDVTRNRGVTEMRMTDYSMQPKMKASINIPNLPNLVVIYLVS